MLASRSERGLVVLIHGIGGLRLEVARIASGLRREGYDTLSLPYPSRKETIGASAARLAPTIRDALADGRYDRMHVVGFSMGGLVARRILTRHAPFPPGRLLFVATPNRGAERARRLRDRPVFRGWFGPAGQELALPEEGIAELCGFPDRPAGVIAGGRGDDEGFSARLAGDDDGTVRVAETDYPGAERALVPYRHHSMLIAVRTRDLAVRFIRTGTFAAEEPLEAAETGGYPPGGKEGE